MGVSLALQRLRKSRNRKLLLYALIRDSGKDPITLEEIEALWFYTYGKIGQDTIRRYIERLLDDGLLLQTGVRALFAVETFRE